LRKALAEGNRLLSDMPQLYQTLRGGQSELIAAEDLKRGDRIVLRAGDVVPVDARLLQDHAQFNMHVVSGETHPVSFKHGAEVLAGAVNLSGKVEVEASADHRESKFERFRKMAEGLREGRTLPQHKALALVFVFAVSLCAAIGFYLWYETSMFAGMATALTIFIVACPCALALAEPVSQAFVLGKAARAGIWIKQRRVFDCLPDIKEVVFDKTGVLTQGAPHVVADLYTCANPRHIQAVTVALEDAADHPLARALRSHFKAVRALSGMTDVKVHAGRGVSGNFSGHRYLITGPDSLDHFSVSAETRTEVENLRSRVPVHATHVLVFEDDAVVALFAIEDPLREEAPQLSKRLEQRGLQQTILSGDRQDIVAAMGRQLGIEDARGGLLPEEKLAYVTRSQQGPILMVGDGLNDMGALAAAHVGITHSHASGAALNFADVVLGKPSLDRIETLFSLIRAGKRANRRAVVISLGYNLTAISLAWAGLIGPLTAAILMPLSSLSVVAVTAWSLRSRKVNTWAS
jgi:Cu2+-exporting ATPase